MSDGNGCTCGAYSAGECGCDADWTSQEVYDLRAEVAALRSREQTMRTTIRELALVTQDNGTKVPPNLWCVLCQMQVRYLHGKEAHKPGCLAALVDQ